MLRPDFERLPLFVGEVMPLIDADDAGKTAAGVVQELFDHSAGRRRAGPYGSPCSSGDRASATAESVRRRSAP